MRCESACGEMVFFFFQAEDGIRDLIVTGVQTCALPISKTGSPVRHCATRRRVCSRQTSLPTIWFVWRCGRERSSSDRRKIGRASWRGRGEISVGAGSFKKKKKNIYLHAT